MLKFQSHPKKLYHPILWEWWRKEDVKSSWKPCKISKKTTQRLTKKSTWKPQLKQCSKNSDWKKILLILLVTLSLFILMKDLWTFQPLKLLEKFNCTWTQWEDTEIHHSFIQFTDWEVFQKVFPESVPSMVEHSCWTLISTKFFSKMVKLLELKVLMVSPIVQLLFAIQLMHWNVDLNKESDLLRKLSDAFVFWTTQSKVLKTFHQSKSSFHKNK